MKCARSDARMKELKKTHTGIRFLTWVNHQIIIKAEAFFEKHGGPVPSWGEAA